MDVNDKADIWALGIILYRLVSGGNHPFESKNDQAMRNAIATKEPKELPEKTHPFMKQLVAKLLNKDREKRPDAASLLKIEKIR